MPDGPENIPEDISPCEWQGDVLVLRIRLQPRASRDEITAIRQGRLCIRITAPPVDGKANAHLLRYLAREFGVSRRAVTLLSGASSRDKRVSILQPRRIPPLIFAGRESIS